MQFRHSVRSALPFSSGEYRLRRNHWETTQKGFMNPAKLRHYRELLLHCRERARGEVNHVVNALQEEVEIDTNLSSAPVHLADVAADAVDADVQVLQTERTILDQINDALGRIDDGTFGTCLECGTPISELRLKALPYTPLCVRCARAGSDENT
jgi:RNA polymerase-binding protein DksA